MFYDGPQGYLSGYIVEDEAYGGPNDSTSYAYQNRITKSSRPLYGIPGTIYIYKIHARYVFGIIDQNRGIPSGIMIRALEPCRGQRTMEQNRQKHGVEITNGPAKLIQALGIHDDTYNLTLCNQSSLGINLHRKRRPFHISTSARIGVSKGPNQSDQARFFVQGNPYVSKMKKRNLLPNCGWRKKTTD